jgi:hypothetical protein
MFVNDPKVNLIICTDELQVDQVCVCVCMCEHPPFTSNPQFMKSVDNLNQNFY